LIPALYGAVPTELSAFNIRSAAVLNPSTLGFLTGTSLLVLLLSSMIMLRPKNVTHWEFPAYLVGIGLLNLVAFCLFQGAVLVDHMMIRYVLLSLFLFMGIAALIVRTQWRPLVAATLLVWVTLNAVQHATLVSDLMRSPPDDPYADLAHLLRERNVAVAAAVYGDCYYLTFMLDRDILVASTEFYRIPGYQQAFKSHTGPGRVAIYDRPADCPDAVQLHHWTVCPVPEDFQ
jgi:hypothetical protein